jgi:mannose-1-phosphate guanylyltransferase
MGLAHEPAYIGNDDTYHRDKRATHVETSVLLFRHAALIRTQCEDSTPYRHSSSAMSGLERTWVLVLAGGGIDPPESQHGHVSNPDEHRFGGLLQPQSLLRMTLSRAGVIVPCERICLLVNRGHKHKSSGSLTSRSYGNAIVQPRHRGSAVEILLAVLTILKRDPRARIVALPAHHYVHNESALASSLLDAATPTAHTRNKLTLVGICPEDADSDLGFIVPGRWFEDGTRSVYRIVHSPAEASAHELWARGALWDSSIVAARAVVFLSVLRARMPDLVDQMEMAMAQGDSSEARSGALTQLYARLPFVDFSRVLSPGAEAECRVITSRPCGWSDLGSARRVAAVVRRLQLPEPRVRAAGRVGRVIPPRVVQPLMKVNDDI